MRADRFFYSFCLKLFFAAICAFGIAASSHAQVKTKAQISNDITNDFPDNTSGAITPAIVRTFLGEQNTSYQQAPTVNAQTGTTYTFLVSDYGTMVTFSNAAPIAVTLPQATGNFSIFNTLAVNVGAGTATITPTTSTICGGATLTLATNQSVWIVSDGTNYQCFKGVGIGTVSSVGLSLPSIFTVTVSPITTTGNLTAVLSTETANTVFAGPTSGAQASPTFRALVAADYPTNTVGLTSLAQIGADTILGNPTGSTGNVVATAAPVLGVAGTNAGSIGLANANGGGAVVTIQNPSATSAYNFQLPAAVGSTNQVLTSQAGLAQTYQNLASLVNAGAGISISGTTAPTIALSVPVTVPNGGTSQTTTPNARAVNGLNIDAITTHGDSNYSILTTDRIVGTSASLTTGRTWTLPTANTVNPGQQLLVADFAGGVSPNALTIARASSDTINGGTSVAISAANGAYLFWPDGVSKWTAQSIGPAAAGGVSSVTCGTGLTGGTITTSGTCAVDIATNSNIWSETANKPVDAAGAASSIGLTALTNASPVAVDFNTLVNATITLTASTTLGNPTNASGAVGRCGHFVISQDGSGSRTLIYQSNWKFSGGTAPTLSTTANAVDILSYCIRTSTAIDATLSSNFK